MLIVFILLIEYKNKAENPITVGLIVRKEERGKRKEERGKRREERGKRKEERGKRRENAIQ